MPEYGEKWYPEVLKMKENESKSVNMQGILHKNKQVLFYLFFRMKIAF